MLLRHPCLLGTTANIRQKDVVATTWVKCCGGLGQSCHRAVRGALGAQQEEGLAGAQHRSQHAVANLETWPANSSHSCAVESSLAAGPVAEWNTTRYDLGAALSVRNGI